MGSNSKSFNLPSGILPASTVAIAAGTKSASATSGLIANANIQLIG